MNFVAARIEPGLLAAFIAVADRKSVSGAVDVLHLSQPAVTAQIKRLEDGLGAPLFLRSVQGMRLTPKGLRLYAYAREIAGLLAEAQAAVAEGNESAGQLKLAASTTIASYVLPAALSAFCRFNPRIGIELTMGNTEEVLRRVRDGLCPLGLVEGLPRAPQLRLNPFVDDELVLIRGVGPRAEEIARKTKSLRRARDLASMPIIWREAGSGTRAVTERALRAAGVNTRSLSYEKVIGSTEGIKAAVAAGLGIAFVSRWSIQDELAQRRVATIPLVDLTIPRTFHWALPAGALPPAAAAFTRYLVSYPPVAGQRPSPRLSGG